MLVAPKAVLIKQMGVITSSLVKMSNCTHGKRASGMKGTCLVLPVTNRLLLNVALKQFA